MNVFVCCLCVGESNKDLQRKRETSVKLVLPNREVCIFLSCVCFLCLTFLREEDHLLYHSLRGGWGLWGVCVCVCGWGGEVELSIELGHGSSFN